ncbi:SdrD B-like domain-containing protein [Crossiella sp. CA-258035]|uniref:SdrD B-like domain-containing protein n=1 Tax=Crossiella sp. CA-258035 TaxID=2981138 RepID=UPI0024BD00B9|nr:SdrD B-like domain-containing protein [Crossiella sp. CA-258035]WHT21620.1 SdrD B-like domain-containing protein [Crossiella sp. CA-258035]
MAAGITPALVVGGLTIAGGGLAPPTAQAQQPVCPAGTTAVPITWGANGAVKWPRNSTSTKATNIAGSGLDLNISLSDPANRNGDDSNPLQNTGEANSGGSLFGWDPRTYTETDGAFGPGFLTIEMNSLNVGDTMTFRFKFSHPVLLPDFSVGDIDYAGLGASPAEEPWNSFQDQILFTANRQGLPVGVTLTPVGVIRPVIAGGTAVGGPYQLNTTGDVAPDAPAGTLRGRTNEPVTEFVLAYSNGPDDVAAEAGPSYPPPIPPLTAPANSVSDSHAVRVNFFTTCLGTGSIGATLYTDIDGDGKQDPGEPGIAGAKVQLLDPQGNVVQTATTDANGKYLFEQLPAFDWTVRVEPATLPAGYTQTGDPDVTKDNRTSVKLNAGQDVLTADFGYQPPLGTVSGTVFSDRDDNGALDSSDDAGIAGVTVTLTGQDLAGNPVSRTTTTGADGKYSFPNVPAGTYQVKETQPPGYIDGKDSPGTNAAAAGNDTFTVTLPPGGSSPGHNFAELPTGSLTGQVYVDANNNGVRDTGEAPISGTAVKLTGTDDAGNPVSLTTTTAADGSYSFDRLRPGSYTVTETQPEGYLDGRDRAGSARGELGNDSVTGVTLGLGQAATGYDFGELPPAGISGKVVEDDGTPIPGVTITLTGIDADGKPVLKTTTSTSDGSWSFPNLPPGNYNVTETQPPGFGDGPDTPGPAGGSATPPDTISGITLDPGENAPGNVFTEKRSSIAGQVYADANNNGVRDAGEAPIPGATVTLTGTDANGRPVSKTATTDAEGRYVFDRLLSGGYTVAETQPPDYLDGKDKAGSAGGLAGNDTVAAILLPGGTAATGYDFGELVPAGISGKVTEDDGTPVPGVTITLTGTDASGNPVIKTTTTKPDGTWSFPNLPPGTYTVTETQPPGFGDGPDKPGSAGGTATVPDTISGITLTPGQSGTDYLFTETRAVIGGHVYVDANNNGIMDSGETGIAGATVTLTGTDVNGQPVSKTVTTAAGGSYEFTKLLSGNYTVTETQPVGYLDGKDKAGNAGGTASNDKVVGITLPAGSAAMGYDFGELPPAGISGKVVEDDGTPIPGVTITVTDKDGIKTTTTTKPDGTWSFPNLPPGTYTVTETQPPGFGDGPDTPGSAGGTPQLPDTFSGITLTPGQSGAGYTFTEKRSSLAGRVYVDTNNNGVQDAGEPGIPGAKVTLTGTDAAGNPVSKNVVTDAKGDYLFERLLGGDYTVAETQPADYTDGKDAVGSAGGTLAPPDSVKLTLPVGTAATGYDFGEVGVAITGTVWVDTDGDGVIDPAEAKRLSGVEIVLLDKDGKQVGRTTTDAFGNYAFPGLPPGDYTVRENQPGGYGTTTPNEVKVTVPAGGTSKADFGEQLGSIGDFVFSDTNANGVQDAGEPGVPGATVILYDDKGTEVAKTTTGADGKYRFTDVPAGSYQIGFHLPPGQAFTVAGKGTDTTGSDPDIATGRTPAIAITVVDGKITQRSDVDAGLVAAKADLAVELTVDRPTANTGEKVTYTGVVSNTGNTPVRGQEYRQTVPPGLTITSVTGDGWTCSVNGQQVVCTRPDVLLPGGRTPPVTVVTAARTPGASLVSTATTRPLDGQVETTLTNNTDTVDLTVLAGKPDPGKLADTGEETGPLVAWGLLLLLGGSGLVATTFRKRRRHN